MLKVNNQPNCDKFGHPACLPTYSMCDARGDQIGHFVPFGDFFTEIIF
jgi:hypothetical protein